MKATYYHTRDQKGAKTMGGTLGMSQSLDLNAAAAQLTARFDVRVTNSGRISFFHGDKPVSLYLSVDPAETAKGQDALTHHRAREVQMSAQAKAAADAKQAVLDDLVDRFGVDEAIHILTKAAS